MDYNKLLEKARKTYSECVTGAEKRRLESIFPELKESEDEKIRKWIRKELESKYVVDNIVNNVMADKALAWLQKQGEQNSIWKPTDEQMEAFTHFVRSIGESGYASSYDDNTKLLYSLLNDLQNLEKQGEQKPADKVEPKFKVGD